VHHLEAILAPKGKAITSLAVLSIDFDDFRLINDRFGHAHGDAVLRQWAAHVGDLVEPGDYLAHLGEDEFAICCTSARSIDAARSIANRILDVTSTPINVGNQSVSVTTTIGIAMSSSDSTAEGLMRNASLAMYSAKDLGRGRLEVFDNAYHDQIKVRNKLRAELSRAVLDHEITAYFQPEISLETGEIVGFEALARWNRTGHRQVLPDEFIPLAEESGLIGAIGLEMLEASCQALRQWEKTDPERRLTVAVNVSVIQLADPHFPQSVSDICRRHGVEPSRICLEMTESSLVDELVAFHALNELKATGVLIALDDFGTGYSSLLRLNRYPIDFLKIDRSFVSELSSSQRDPVVITAVLAIAEAMGISTISEGIEEGIQWQRLRELGCHTGQGFLFSRAVNLRQATKLISSNRRYELPTT
jgi:diguanylate cyclase (GGDEF)-like protein